MTPSFSLPSESETTPASAEFGRWEGRVFGAFQLISPDGTDATPTSRKARALVAYLLTAMDDSTTRERLAGLLWSERGEDQARASLRQTLHEIRAMTLGDAPPIRIDRTRVTLVASRVTTDRARLDEAGRGDDASALVAMVGQRPPEFLADLDSIDPAFDDWLSVERTRHRDARRSVLLAVADRRLAASDADAAQHLCDCLLACDPADETAARIAMQASHRRGDRDAVRRTFASVTDALHRLVGVQPSDETEAAYRRLMTAPRSTGEPLLVLATDGDARDPLPALEDAPAGGVPPEGSLAALADSPNAAVSPSARWPRRWTLLAAGVALLSVAVVELVGSRNSGIASLPRVLLVEPMKVAPSDAAAEVLWSGFSAELASVIVGTPAFVVRDTEHGSGDAPDRTFLVAADAHRQDGVLSVSLRLLAQKDGAILWSTTLARPVSEVAALREQLAVKVADVAVCALDGRHTDLREFRPEMLQLLFGACDLRHTDSPEAAKLLVRLMQEVPAFSHGWALLAAANAGEGDLVAADATHASNRTDLYARRAIQLDPHDGDAYFGRAFALEGIGR